MNGNGSSSGRRRDDVARAEVYREDDVREVRGLAELILPSQRDAEEGTGGFVLAGSALLGLASSGTCSRLRFWISGTERLRAGCRSTAFEGG